MSNLKPLKWRETSVSASVITPMHTYEVIATENNKFYVKKVRLETQKLEEVTGFDTAQAAKDWCFKEHYAVKMQPYVIPDSITDISNWFKAAKPEPTNKDKLVQIGCHYEEVAEMMVAVISDDHMGSHAINNCANGFKSVRDELVDLMQPSAPLELLDALCDQIVTATGVGYMMGFDIEGALKEVIRSNNSKFENGKPLFNEQGKIMKGKDYSEPDLTPFLGGNL